MPMWGSHQYALRTNEAAFKMVVRTIEDYSPFLNKNIEALAIFWLPFMRILQSPSNKLQKLRNWSGKGSLTWKHYVILIDLTSWVMQEEEGADGGTGTDGKLESLPGSRCNIILAAQYYCQAGVKTLTHRGGSEMSVLHHHHFLQSSHCAFANENLLHHLQITFKDQRHSQ